MFNIGPTELVVILVIALIVFGPKRLPEVGRTVGKSLREFRRASEELREGLDMNLDEPPTVGSMPPGEPTWETSGPGPEEPVTDPATGLPAGEAAASAHTEARRPREALRGAGAGLDGRAQDPAGTPGDAGGGRAG
jgi:sec-independent protein translocase protein TatA